jgi:flagella basal body P-ring formation protein FlgA
MVKAPYVMRTRWAGIVAVSLATLLPTPLVARSPELRPAADLIRAAVLDRVGAEADVSLTGLDVPGSTTMFREARPDPEGRLGKPMRFTLTTGTGAYVFAVVSVHVSVGHAVTRRAIARGATLVADDLDQVSDEVRDAPLRRLPTTAQLIGGRALRPLPSGAIVLPGVVVTRRIVEPGDRVTVLATSGAIEVSAAMIAADGGRIGDVIRVVNPDTRRYLRGRILEDGRIEVMYER